MKFKFLTIGFILTILNLSFSPARQPIILKNADSLIGISGENFNVRNFIGNVRFEQGEIVLMCDTAVQYIDQNRVELIGNVWINKQKIEIRSQNINYEGNQKIAVARKSIEIKDSATKIIAKNGTYNLETNIANFQTDVVVENDSIIIFSDILFHNTDTEESVVQNNVKLFGKKNRIAIICDSMVYKPKMDFVLAYGNANFFFIDSLEKDKYDTLSISAVTIFGNQVKGFEFYQFIDNVEIVKNKLSSKCKMAEFFASGDSLVLTGDPIVWYDSLQLYADTIIARFPGRTIQSIRLQNNAISISSTDTLGIGKIDQISGQNIDIFFEQDSIRTIISRNQANSVYFIEGKDDEQGGVQRSGADSIFIYFQNNEVDKIIWKSSPFLDFYPENIWPDDLSQYYLPRFRIRYDRPRQKPFPQKPIIRY